SIGETYLRARRRGQQRWAGAMLFLFAYHLAFMINGSFDVFLEGPMGGIWFWTIFGVGVGALWCWRYAPGVLADDPDMEPLPRGFEIQLPPLTAPLAVRVAKPQ